MDYPLYNQKAESIGKVNLPDNVFSLPVNDDLVYQVVVSQISNRRQRVAHTKDRSDVRGGGKKPWRQKGTGRARHGSIRSPIWKGGGVTFGPRKEKNFKKKINKKMARKALFTILSSKARSNNILVIDSINLIEWKTKEMAKVLKNFSNLIKGGKKILVVGKDSPKEIQRVIRNIPNFRVVNTRNLNALNVISVKNILFFENAIDDFNNNLKTK